MIEGSTKMKNYDFFEFIDTEDKAYWLGFMCADGHMSNNQVRINLSWNDSAHLVKFANMFNKTVSKRVVFNKKMKKEYFMSTVVLGGKTD